jgi:hypothetical protein
MKFSDRGFYADSSTGAEFRPFRYAGNQKKQMNRTVSSITATILCWFFLSLAFTQVVFAYIPQGAHLLELMTGEIGTPDSIFVEQKQFLMDMDSEDGPVVFNETLRYQLPRKFRSDIETGQARCIRVISGQQSITVLNGRSSDRRPKGFDLYPELLLIRSRYLLEKRLTETGIDVGQSSLGRFQGEPVYIIGAKYPDLSLPQLWLDKKTLRPIRWIVGGRRNPEIKEIRYLEWKEIGPYGYPMRIEFYLDGVLVRRAEVQHIAVNEFFEEALFDIENLYTEHPTANSDDLKDEPVGAGAVQQSIDEFRKIMD